MASTVTSESPNSAASSTAATSMARAVSRFLRSRRPVEIMKEMFSHHESFRNVKVGMSPRFHGMSLDEPNHLTLSFSYQITNAVHLITRIIPRTSPVSLLKEEHE